MEIEKVEKIFLPLVEIRNFFVSGSPCDRRENARPDLVNVVRE